MNLVEVSVIDERKIPCYVGTSIETRTEKQTKLKYRGKDFKAKIVDNTEQKPKIELKYQRDAGPNSRNFKIKKYGQFARG